MVLLSSAMREKVREEGELIQQSSVICVYLCTRQQHPLLREGRSRGLQALALGSDFRRLEERAPPEGTRLSPENSAPAMIANTRNV